MSDIRGLAGDTLDQCWIEFGHVTPHPSVNCSKGGGREGGREVRDGKYWIVCLCSKGKVEN